MTSIVASGVRGKLLSEVGDLGNKTGRVGIEKGIGDALGDASPFIEDEFEEWEKVEEVGEAPGVLPRRT